MSPEIRNAVQQLATNNDKITLSLSTHLEENNDREETNQIIRKYLFLLHINFIIFKVVNNINMTFRKLKYFLLIIKRK